MENSAKQTKKHVLSCRLNDDALETFRAGLDGRTVQEFLVEAIGEKLIRERQARIDAIVARARRAA